MDGGGAKTPKHDIEQRREVLKNWREYSVLALRISISLRVE